MTVFNRTRLTGLVHKKALEFSSAFLMQRKALYFKYLREQIYFKKLRTQFHFTIAKQSFHSAKQIFSVSLRSQGSFLIFAKRKYIEFPNGKYIEAVGYIEFLQRKNISTRFSVQFKEQAFNLTWRNVEKDRCNDK